MKKELMYVLFASAMIALLLVAGCSQNVVTQDNLKWRCSMVNCTEVVQLTGTEWAQQNCVITENEGTLCQVNFDNGESQIIPLDQLNLSAIQATQCVSYECVEETPYRAASYTIEPN